MYYDHDVAIETIKGIAQRVPMSKKAKFTSDVLGLLMDELSAIEIYHAAQESAYAPPPADESADDEPDLNDPRR